MSKLDLHAQMPGVSGPGLSGIQEAREIVNLFNGCNESFNQRFTFAELITLYRVWKTCEWVFTPDEWSQRQVDEAIKLGIVPEWDENEKPLYRPSP